MSDGANLGVTPERAIETIIGGKEHPTAEEQRGPEQMRARLEAKDDNINGYDAHAEVIAKYLLRLYDKYPETRNYPTQNVYRRDDEGEIIWEGGALILAIDEVAKREYTDEQHPFRLALSEATGFTFGWAVNAARYAAGLGPVASPAIVEMKTNLALTQENPDEQ